MNNRMKEGKKGKKRNNLYFLGFVIILYIILFFLNPKSTYSSLKTSGDIFIKLIPVLLLVIFLMGLISYFLRPKIISKYLGKVSGIKGWFIAISTGILSHGPIYVWFPLLKELRKQGMRTGLVAVFLYNRAIKIPLLPVLIYYFGKEFTIVLLLLTVVASLIEGKIIEMLGSIRAASPC